MARDDLGDTKYRYELVIRDSGPDPETAKQVIRRVVTDDKARRVPRSGRSPAESRGSSIADVLTWHLKGTHRGSDEIRMVDIDHVQECGCREATQDHDCHGRLNLAAGPAATEGEWDEGEAGSHRRHEDRHQALMCTALDRVAKVRNATLFHGKVALVLRMEHDRDFLTGTSGSLHGVHVDHLHTTLSDERAGDRHIGAHLVDQQSVRGLMIF